MQKIINFLQKTEQLNSIKTDVLKAPFHSYMLITSDKLLLEAYATLMASFLMCKDSACLTCNTCQKILLNSHPDMFVLPKGENFLVEDAKFIIDNAILVPMEADSKVFIIKDFSGATIASQNKLLKILEEPPQNTYFVLLVDNPNAVLPTVMSRCKKVYLKSLKTKQIEEFLQNSVPSSKAKIIAEVSGGSLAKAQALGTKPEYIELTDNVLKVISSLRHSSSVLELVNILSFYKGKAREILELAENYFEDILLVLLCREDIITNVSKKNILIKISEGLTPTGVDLIIKRIYFLKKRLDANCSINGIFDNLLLYILEVKATCS